MWDSRSDGNSKRRSGVASTGKDEVDAKVFKYRSASLRFRWRLFGIASSKDIVLWPIVFIFSQLALDWAEYECNM